MATIFGNLELVRGHVTATVHRTEGKFNEDQRCWIVGVDYQGDPDDITEALCAPLRSYASEDEAYAEIEDCQDNEHGYDEFFVACAVDCVADSEPDNAVVINDARMARVVEVSGCETPYVVVNMDSREVVYVASHDGVRGYIAGAQGTGVVTAKLAIHEYESLCSNFTVAGYNYTDPATKRGLWLLGNPSITDDGKYYAVTAVDASCNTYRIEWVCIDPLCEDESNACDWDNYTVTPL